MLLAVKGILMMSITVTWEITRISYFQRFLEIGFEVSACTNSVYQAYLLPLLKHLGTRLRQYVDHRYADGLCYHVCYCLY